MKDGMSPLHIGIVACTAEGAELCYRTICAEAAALLGPHRQPKISMHVPSLHRYLDALHAGDVRGIACLMLESAEKLAQIGANLLICPDNSIRHGSRQGEPGAARPWLQMACLVAEEAVRRGYRKMGGMGAVWLVTTGDLRSCKASSASPRP